jgi:hypothetical protein
MRAAAGGVFGAPVRMRGVGDGLRDRLALGRVLDWGFGAAPQRSPRGDPSELSATGRRRQISRKHGRDQAAAWYRDHAARSPAAP